MQVDNDAVIPFYSWLAKQFVFCDHHFGLGSNSTSGHMLAIGGQTPTLKNPPFVGPHPVWDLPSIFTVAEAAGVSWAAFPDQAGYPTKFYTTLTAAPGNGNVHPPSQFIPMAKAGTLPQVCYVWSPAGYDEHPPRVSDPDYVTKGQDLVWQRVQAVIDGGGWADTTFILTWDDWGGYADSVPTPDIETAPGRAAPGRVPGHRRLPHPAAHVRRQGRARASTRSGTPTPRIPKTIIDLLGLPADGRPPRRRRALAGRPRRPDADPAGAAGARHGDHPADPAAPDPGAGRRRRRGPARSASRCRRWSPSTAACCRPRPTVWSGPNHPHPPNSPDRAE